MHTAVQSTTGGRIHPVLVGDERFSEAMAFPMAAILARYRREHNVKEALAELHEREIKRYLILSALHPDKSFPMVVGLDDLWHTFIIYTREYAQFCRSLGVSFIHHRVCEGSTPIHLAPMFHTYVKHYTDVFGEEVPRMVWGRTDDYTCAGEGDGCGSITSCDDAGA